MRSMLVAAIRRAPTGRTEGSGSAGRWSEKRRSPPNLNLLRRPLRAEISGAQRQRGVATALADHGLLAEQVVLDRLSLHPGDTVRLGNASFTVRGALISEPDRVAAAADPRPPRADRGDTLASTGLIAPGSMVQYALRATLPDPGTAPAGLAALRQPSTVKAGGSATRMTPRPA